MTAQKTWVIYDDDKIRIDQDRWNFIIRKKPLLQTMSKNRFKYATYLTQPCNVLWEVCDCRKMYKKIDASEIQKAVHSHSRVNKLGRYEPLPGDRYSSD